MKNELIKNLKPLYAELVKNTPENYRKFFIQCGEDFPQEKKTGILCVGRATNGGYAESNDIDKLFEGGESDNIVNTDGGKTLEVIDNAFVKHSDSYYPKSQFWRVIRSLSSYYYLDAWYKKIAWSNLYKIAPQTGFNPTSKIMKKTHDIHIQILAKEIETLSPRVVVMFTGLGWAESFVRSLNGGELPQPKAEKVWGEKNKAILYTTLAGNIIVSEHPMTRPEACHIEAIKLLIEKIKS